MTTGQIILAMSKTSVFVLSEFILEYFNLTPRSELEAGVKMLIVVAKCKMYVCIKTFSFGENIKQVAFIL